MTRTAKGRDERATDQKPQASRAVQLWVAGPREEAKAAKTDVAIIPTPDRNTLVVHPVRSHSVR